MYLYGASGHAKVVMDICRACDIEVEGLIDDNPDIDSLCGLPVSHDAMGLSPVIITIGNCRIRRLIAERLQPSSTGFFAKQSDSVDGQPEYESAGSDGVDQCSETHSLFGTAIHPSAIISPSASIGEGTVVMQGAVIQAEARIGRHCIINTRASIDHECVIGDYVHVAPGCTISGDVHIGDGTWVGVGATVVQGVRIGRDCFIGAGAVVVSDIPDGSLAYGVPCRVIGPNTK